MKDSLNDNQSLIFDAVFDENISMKNDCPKIVAHYGGHGSNKYWASISLALEDYYNQIK